MTGSILRNRLPVETSPGGQVKPVGALSFLDQLPCRHMRIAVIGQQLR
jgi:hypothetical protein